MQRWISFPLRLLLASPTPGNLPLNQYYQLSSRQTIFLGAQQCSVVYHLCSFLSAQINLLSLRKELLRRWAVGAGVEKKVRCDGEETQQQLLVKVDTKCAFRFLALAFLHLVVHSRFTGIILKSKRNGELRHVSYTGYHLNAHWDWHHLGSREKSPQNNFVCVILCKLWSHKKWILPPLTEAEMPRGSFSLPSPKPQVPCMDYHQPHGSTNNISVVKSKYVILDRHVETFWYRPKE